MCGRFTQARPWSDLVELYRITEPVTASAPSRRYNIAPTHDVAVVRAADVSEGRVLVALRWGLVPPWARDPAQGARLINARAETVAEKPAFRAAVRARRCLVIADGFYEWQAGRGRTKRPYHIAAPDGQSLAFAGVWERWSRGDAAPLETCAIITTAATPDLAGIHHRMPAILPPADQDLWLDRTAPVEEACQVLRPYAGALGARPVSRWVNAVDHDDPACIAPLDAEALPVSGDLFAESSPPLCHTR